jgi:DnaJ homolog subfamily B member 12
VVSRAFQILSDPDKKARYDQFGGDPDNRFSSSGSGGATSSPFSGFAHSPGQRGGFYEDEISPEELFNRFFGGGGMGGGPFGPFGGFGGGGSQFVFNMGGGPGFTVHRMGGPTPRRRPQAANGEAAPPSGLTALTQLLPLLLLFILPLLSSLFSGSTDTGPSIRFDSAAPPNTMHRVTPKYKVDYFVNPVEVDGYSSRKFHQLDQRAEVDYITTLRYNCEMERNTRQQLLQDAHGWFAVDEEKIKQARSMPMRSCNRLDELRVRQQY